MTTQRKATSYLEAEAPAGAIRIPITRTEGVADGPTLAVVGGVHGAEYPGIDAVRRLFGEVDENVLSGRLLTIPCLNVPAFYGFTPHVNPVDGENPARRFPGSATGSYTERMVDLAWRKVLVHADYIVDVHGGD